MKAETLQKRLDKKYEGSKRTKAYQAVKDLIYGTNKSKLIENKGKKIRTQIAKGSGKFNYIDYTNNVLEILNLIGVKSKYDNDHPKLGAKGYHLLILTKIDTSIN